MVDLNVALAYLKFGWSIIPVHTIVNERCTCGKDDCATPGKHPRLRWTEFTNDPPTRAQVKAWFTDDFLGSNIGLVTGSVSDIMVVDCDGPDGLESAKKHLKLPPQTLIARTGGGGLHLFYRLAGGNVASKIGAFPHVDIKAEHGFVVLPPSIHISGNRYKWVRRLTPASIDTSQFPSNSNGNGLDSVSVNERGWLEDCLMGVDEGGRGIAAAKLVGYYANLGLDLRGLWYLTREWNRHNRPPMAESELMTTVKFFYRKHRTEVEPVRITSREQLLQIIQSQGREKEGR